MKAVFILAILVMLVMLPDGSEAGWWRRTWQKVKAGARRAWQKVKQKIVEKLRNNRRDIGDFDLDQDGTIDQKEMSEMIGERHARDLWDLMDAEGALTMEQFERKVRELDEIEEDDELDN